jgi:hypothetical protein
MGDKGSMSWTDWRGREQIREVNQIIDIRNFKDTMGYAWLLMAANPHLSATEIQRWLELIGPQHQRGESWVKKRRKLFVPVGKVFPHSPTNRDGKDERAFAIMRQLPTASLRYLVRVLKEYGITRGKDWVRANRSR